MPSAHVVHVAQVSDVPSTRYLPDAHELHCEFAAVVQVRDDAQPATAVHAAHTVSVVEVHAALAN